MLILEMLEDRTTPSGGLSNPLSLTNLPANAVSVTWDGSPEYMAAGQWVVKLNLPGYTYSSDATTLLAAANAEVSGLQFTKYLGQGLYLVNADPTASYQDVNAALSGITGYQYAEPDAIGQIAVIPNNPLFSQQWDLLNTGQNGGTAGDDIDMTQAWNIATGTLAGVAPVVVGSIDTGVDYNQPDLYENIWLNNAEIPTCVMHNLTRDDGNPYIDMYDLQQLNNQGPGKIIPPDGSTVVTPEDILAPMVTNSEGQYVSGGWAYPNNNQDGMVTNGQPCYNDFFGWNFVNDSNDPMDDNGHGTHTAGTIAAKGNSGVGTAGIDWNAQIAIMECFDQNGYGTLDNVVAAINYAGDLKRLGVANIKLTTNSYTFSFADQSLLSAIQYNASEGMLFVCAAGNSYVGRDDDYGGTFPAAFSTQADNIIAVAATDDNDQLASFSDYGPQTVALAAPGVNILSTVPTYGVENCDPSGYMTLSGTSMATPHVAGVAALAWSVDPYATYQQVKAAILDGVDPIPALKEYVSTGGELNAYNTLGLMEMAVSSTTPAAGTIVSTPPTSFTVQFNSPYDPASIVPADFAVNGKIPTSITQQDNLTIILKYATSPVTREGRQTLTVAAGAVARVDDKEEVQGYSDSFYYDTMQLTVTSVAPSTGSSVVLPATIIVHCNEAINPASVSPSNLTVSQGTVSSAALVKGDPTSVQYTISGQAADGTLLTVTLANGVLQDTFGTPGLGTTATFQVNVPISAFPTLTQLGGAGTLTYSGSTNGSIQFAGDTVSYTLPLDAGQNLSVLVIPSGTLQPTINVYDPWGNHLASGTATAVGANALVSQVSILTSGTYTITIGGQNGTTGIITTQAYLNAALQAGQFQGGASNTTLATAQSLDSGFLATSFLSSISRAGVIGDLALPVSTGDVLVGGDSYGGPSNLVLFNSNGVVATLNDPSLQQGTVQCVRLGANGDIYVGVDTDPGMGDGGEILHFNGAGMFISCIKLPNDQPFDDIYPPTFAVATDGTLWVPQPNAGQLLHLDGLGNILGSYNVGGRPEAVAIRPDGQLLIDDVALTAADFNTMYAYNVQILLLNPATGSLSTYATTTTAFPHPIGFQVAPNGDLLDCDAMGLSVYDLSGNLIQTINGDFTEAQQADAAGDIFAINLSDPLYYYVPTLEFLYSTGGSSSVILPNNMEPSSLSIYGTDFTAVPPPAATVNYYSFTLQAGQLATVALSNLQGGDTDIALLNASGNVLAEGVSGGLTATQSINGFIAQTGGTYYVEVTGAVGQYDLTVTKGAEFDPQTNSTMATALPLAPDVGGDRAVLGDIGAGATDTYLVNANNGNSLVLSTTTPYADWLQPNQPHNTLDPVVSLYNANGNLLASNSNGFFGNALIFYNVSQSGTYYVQVTGANGSQGEYTLTVWGATGALPAFTVTSTNPPAGAYEQSLPSITVNFNGSVLVSTLSQVKATLGGQPATGYTVNDGGSVTWFFNPLPGANDVPYTFKLTGNGCENIQDVNLSTFSETIYQDTVPPTVVKTSIAEGALVQSTTLTIKITFSEPMNTTVFNVYESMSLFGMYTFNSYTPTSYSWNTSGTVLTLNFTGMVDDSYTLTLFSATPYNSFGFQDLAGNPLAPGDFNLDFVLDSKTIPLPAAFSAVSPLDTVITNASITESIPQPGLSSTFTLSLPANQLITLDLTTDWVLQATMSLYDPSGNLIATGTALDWVSNEFLLNTVPVIKKGTYKIVISGANDTPGMYTLDVTMNAAWQTEVDGVPTNESIGQAQNLNGAFMTQAGISTAAVLGGSLYSYDQTDWYSVNLTAGQKVTITLIDLAPWGTWSTGQVSLTDSSGNVLASSGQVEDSQEVSFTFTVPRGEGGLYDLSVTGTSLPYALVITKS